MDSLHYLDPNPDGNPFVLLIHGLGSEASSWRLQMDFLCLKGFRPVAIDVPGFGKSPYPEGKWSIKRIAEIFSGFMTKLTSQPAIICGISMGGTIALQMALDWQSQAAGLVLLNTFARLYPRKPDEWFYFLQRLMIVQFMDFRQQADRVSWRIFPKPDQVVLRSELKQEILQADRRAYQAAMRSLGLFDVRKRLKNLNIPVLILSGENDTTVSRPNQDELARKIPTACQVVIPDSGHGSIADQPDIVNCEIYQFITSLNLVKP
ncbi:MAG TPA: alpha/beta hydrolase [Anaerolineaceae bacterium]